MASLETRTWVCENCGAVQEGKVRVRIVKGDVTGCSECIKPDPEIVERVWEQILISAVARQLWDKFGLHIANVPPDIVWVLGRWSLGGPRKTLKEELRDMGVTSTVEELVREHLAKRQMALEESHAKSRPKRVR